jgi:hypothetical protein
MPELKKVVERYKEDPDFRTRMKENSRKRYLEMKEALEFYKRYKTTPPADLPPFSSVDQTKPSSS